jgi:SAM-dependent methyltransferase
MLATASCGRDRYAEIYRGDVDAQAGWLALGACNKVDSIEELLRSTGVQVETLVELGCGTGAVIAECQRRKLATHYSGVDFSPQAVDFARARHPGITFERLDITQQKPSCGRADVVVLSHVIEHLEAPGAVLGRLPTLGKYAVIEVPLEDLPASRIKNLFRDRTKNRAAHVAWFTADSFRHLVRSHRLPILAERIYVPTLSLSDIWTLPAGPLAWKAKMSMTANILPRIARPLWQRFYMAHHAILCDLRERAVEKGPESVAGRV